ncbi:MAG: FAD-dependent oxidoreductase [Pseudomonadota bacterium]|nr:FAD-dependent oxidoreductase [Pseudomonadota bacterium]
MNNNTGKTTSLWMATADVPPRPALEQDIQTEVCIIGAGIAGLSTAYFLAHAGKKVVVLEAGAIGGGMSARTTAHINNAFDDGYAEVERLHGAEGARGVADSHSAAIDHIEAIVRKENIDCEFERVDGYLFVPRGESPEALDRELAAAQRAGLQGVERLARAPLDCFDTGPCLRFPRQGQFHLLKYLAGLAAAVERAGGVIHANTRVRHTHSGRPAQARTEAGATVSAGHLVVATNSPINDHVTLHTKQAPYTTYVIGARVPGDAVPPMQLWDTADPYHYVRVQRLPQADYDVLMVGGEDHKTGQAQDAQARWQRLEAWARERFPMIEAVDYRWSGQVMEPVDALAFIGRNPGDSPNVYVATGDSGDGMTHGTLAGMLLADLILGRENPWAGLYDPARKPLSAVGEYLSENLNVARQFADYVSGGEADSVDAIAPGQGAVVRSGLTKIAAYRDEDGALHRCSAVCTHLNCIVAWNPAEATWDCPCHGSRFDRYGRVINGPAHQDLKRVSE